jgi:hypothetical protein
MRDNSRQGKHLEDLEVMGSLVMVSKGQVTGQ